MPGRSDESQEAAKSVRRKPLCDPYSSEIRIPNGGVVTKSERAAKNERAARLKCAAMKMEVLQ